jgi:hypothetical protein
MSKNICLTRGKFALVDDDIYEYLNQWKWIYSNGYAIRDDKISGKRIRMHREILDADVGVEIDHINRDRLDNRKINLRVCSRSENRCNCGIRSDNTSGFKGVYWHKRMGKWRAVVHKNNKEISLGYYSSPEDAAYAYDLGAKKYHGKFAVLNFKNTETE